MYRNNFFAIFVILKAKIQKKYICINMNESNYRFSQSKSFSGDTCTLNNLVLV